MSISRFIKHKKLEANREKKTPFLSGYQTENTPFINAGQAKLKVGSPNSKAEQQADKMAAQVTRGESVQTKEKEAQTRILRQEEEEAQTKMQRQPEEEEEMLQSKVLQRAEEEEAQTRIMRQEEEEAQTKTLNRKADPANSTSATLLQPKTSATPPPITSELENLIDQEKPSGFALPGDILQEMNQKFAYDFSDVKIHTGNKAAFICDQIRAQAFTLGKHIFFNTGKYLPQTQSGKELLAHELTHIIQQNP